MFAPGDTISLRFVETWIETTAGKPCKKSQVKMSRWYSIESLCDQDILNDLDDQGDAQRANHFFGVCPRVGQKLFEQECQIRVVRCLWSDLDSCTVEQALERCRQAGLPLPSIIVRSGHGVHLYWLLAEPYLIDDAGEPFPIWRKYDQATRRNRYYRNAEKTDEVFPKTFVSPKCHAIKQVIKGIAKQIGGDHTEDLARMMRLPGTLNRKDCRNGKEPALCELVEIDKTRKYHLTEFGRFRFTEPARPPSQDSKGLPPSEYSGVSFDKLSKYRHQEFAKRYHDSEKAVVGERSDLDFELVRYAQFCRLDEDAVWDTVQNISKFAERGRGYFDTTWQNALKCPPEMYLKAEEEAEADALVQSVSQDHVALLPAQPAKCANSNEDWYKKGTYGYTDKRYHFAPIDSRTFEQAKYRVEWLVKRLLVRGQPCIIGGPKKVLKTSSLVDLVLSLGSGQPFLGSFQVYKPCRTVLISGESGEFTLQETARRICQAKGIRLGDTDCFWDFRLPQLCVPQEVAELSKGLAERKIEAAVIDPLYLCLLAGQGEKTRNAGNIYDMGPLLLTVARACLDVGYTPLLAHHAKKNLVGSHEPLDLDDLSFSGVQEFARQWMLLSRRAPYVAASGIHQLWLSAGGSCGHGGLWAVDVDEGVLGDDFTGRKWQITVMTANQAKEVRETEKQEKKKEEDEKARSYLLEQLDVCTLDLRVKTKFRSMLGWNAEKFDRIVAQLIQDKKVEWIETMVTAGNGATRKASVLHRRT